MNKKVSYRKQIERQRSCHKFFWPGPGFGRSWRSKKLEVPGPRPIAELTTGQWVVGHGSNGSTNLGGSRGSRVSTRDPLTHFTLYSFGISRDVLVHEKPVTAIETVILTVC